MRLAAKRRATSSTFRLTHRLGGHGLGITAQRLRKRSALLAHEVRRTSVAVIISTAPTVSIFCGERVFSITAGGRLSRDEVFRTIEEYYVHTGERDVLWDLTAADISAITHKDFRDIAAFAIAKLGQAPTRKIAYVVGDTATYTRICTYITIAFKSHVPAEYSVFLSLDSAEQWLARH